MPFVDYANDLTLREARAQYFDRSQLGDGGYAERWVVLRIGSLPIGAVPNTAQRVRSVRLHDLHHVLTGYDTNWTGEAEIAAWELASGCADHFAAWFFNSFAFVIGCFISPRAVLAATRRGRRERNLYSGEWQESLLKQSVGEMRADLGIRALCEEAVLTSD
jgi:hypothetical protein